MTFSLDELHTFVTVAREGNMTRAAGKLGVTQPALSWSVRRMEEKLDHALFVRTKKGVVLTRAGEMLLNRAEKLRREWENLTLDIREGQHEIRGSYSLGVHPTVALYTLPRFCPDLLASHPGLELRLVHRLSREVAEDVIELRVDLGIVVDPPAHPDLTRVPLYRDEICFWVRDREAIESPPSLVVCKSDLPQTEPLLAQAQEAGLLHQTRVMFTTELKLVEAMVASGSAVGLLPATIALNAVDGAFHRLPDTPLDRQIISLIWRADLQTSKASKAIRQSIVEALQQEPPVRTD